MQIKMCIRDRDYDSEGLLVMTNDGELAYRLTHPKFCMDKTYSAICDGLLTKEQIAALEQGVLLEDGPTHPAKVEEVYRLRNGNTAFNITIHEGRNRQVRRMLEAVGHETLALKRVALGPLRLGDLPSGTDVYKRQILTGSCPGSWRLWGRRIY